MTTFISSINSGSYVTQINYGRNGVCAPEDSANVSGGCFAAGSEEALNRPVQLPTIKILPAAMERPFSIFDLLPIVGCAGEPAVATVDVCASNRPANI